MDIVVSGGSDPDRPIPAPKARPNLLLQAIAVGVFLVAAATAYNGWNVYQQTQDARVLNCAYFTSSGDEERGYEDMGEAEKKIIDQLDCDVPGR